MDAVNPQGSGDITKTNIDWTISKNVTRRPSPILVNGNLFMFNDKGIASCVRAVDGKILWQERIRTTFAASPIFDGDEKLWIKQSLDCSGLIILCGTTDPKNSGDPKYVFTCIREEILVTPV